MRRLVLTHVALTLVAIAGCNFGTLDSLSQDQPASGGDEITTTAAWFAAHYEKGTDAEIKAKMADFDGVIDRTGSVPIQEKIGNLTKDDLTLVGFPTNDAGQAQGMLIVTELDCPLDKVEKILIALNQTTIYPGLYAQYNRTYTSSAADYLGRKSPTVTWRTDYTASALSRTYSAVLNGGARLVPDGNPHGGAAIFSRTVLTAPATFTQGGDDSGFAQDYQIEVYYERKPGKTTHFYALWRDFHLGSISSSADIYVSLVLGNLSDADGRLSKVCREGTPKPVTE